jgi:predicted nucleic acid-binding protein
VIVVDANVWLAALIDAGPTGETCRQVMESDPHWIMPSHCPLEVLRALSKYELAGKISATASSLFAKAVWDAVPQIVTLEGIELKHLWSLRHNVSVYDAVYVVIAMIYQANLVTCDQRLARAVARLDVQVHAIE